MFGRYKATWKREFKIPWREAGPPNHLDDKVDSDQRVVDQELSLSAGCRLPGFHKGPYVGVSRPRSWSHLPVLGAISWAFISKS